MITAISGLPGSGKTEWIREQIAKSSVPICYFSPGTANFPIDAICLESEFRELNIPIKGQIEELVEFSQAGGQVYLELSWQLELSACESLLQTLQCHRIAIISATEAQGELGKWADEIILSDQLDTDKWIEMVKNHQLQIHRPLLTGQVLDFPSLETFWTELTQGAYGEVIRVKGIFDIIDGQYIYGEFIEGLKPTDFQALNFPRHLEGRPNRFSGLEIVGQNLDKDSIGNTLGDFCLSDEAVFYYQKQVKESLALEKEEIK